MWSLKKDNTNELIYKTKIDSQTQKTWLPKGKGQGGISWEFEINRYTLLHKTDKQGPTVQHREPYSISCNNL